MLRFFIITTLFYSCTAFHNPFQAGTFNALLSETDNPIAIIVNPPATLSNQSSFEISIAGVGVTHYKYSINSAEYSGFFSVSQPIALSSLPDGSYQLRVVGCNSSFKWQGEDNATEVSWVVDSSIVFIGLINTPQKLTNNTSINITVSGLDIVSYKYKLDESAWSSEILVDVIIQSENIPDGSHIIYVCGKRNNGLWQAEEESTQYQWVVDTVAPVVTVTDKISASGSPSLDGTIDDSDALITLKINNITFNAINEANGFWKLESGVIQPVLSTGTYPIEVTAVDKAFNSSIVATGVLKIDETLVLAVLENAPQKFTDSSSIDITVSGVGIVFYKYKLDGGVWSAEIPISTHIITDNLTAGDHTISVLGKKTDGVWQTEVHSTVYQWNINTTPIVAVLSGLPETITSTTGWEITVAGIDVAYYKYQIDDGVYSSEFTVTNKIILSNLLNKQYTINVIGANINRIWQKIEVPTTYSWTVDSVLPKAILTNTPQEYTDIKLTDIAVGGVDLVVYKYKLDGGVWSAEIPIATHIIIDNLSDGDHIISVAGKKSNGLWQKDADATIYNWNINTVPVIAVLSGFPQEFSKIKTTDISVSGTNVVYYKYKVDTGAYSSELPVSNKISLTGLTDKKYTISVLGANENRIWQKIEIPTVYSWTVDTAAPVITANTKTTSVVSPDLSGTVNDQSATIQLLINESNYTPTNNISGVWLLDAGLITDLTNDAYDYTVSATDLAGNTGTGSGTLTIDTTVPTVILSNLPSSVTNIDSIAITAGGPDIVSYKYKINDGIWSDFIPVSTPIVESSLSDGNYTIYACGKKAVGTEQLEQNATSSTWIVDTTPPVITLVGEPVIYLNKGDVYTSPVDGATVTDTSGEIISAVKSGVPDSTISGVYLETYSAIDSAGNIAIPVSRKIVVYKAFDGTTVFTDADNKIESSTVDKTIYLDYDDQFIYIGYMGEQMNLNNRILYFALNCEETGTVGSTIIDEVQWFEGRRVNLPFKAKYLYMAKHYINISEGQNLTQKYKRISDGTVWGERVEIKDPNINEFRLYTSDNTTKTSLYAINRANIGNPQGKISFVVYVKNVESYNDGGYGWMFSSAPLDAIDVDGIGEKTFTKYFELDLNSSEKPNVAAVVITPP